MEAGQNGHHGQLVLKLEQESVLTRYPKMEAQNALARRKRHHLAARNLADNQVDENKEKPFCTIFLFSISEPRLQIKI